MLTRIASLTIPGPLLWLLLIMLTFWSWTLRPCATLSRWLPYALRPSTVRARRSSLSSELNKLNKSPQTLRGSFSAVSTATIARMGIFFTAQIAKFQPKPRHNLAVLNAYPCKNSQRFPSLRDFSSRERCVGISRTCSKFEIPWNSSKISGSLLNSLNVQW